MRVHVEEISRDQWLVLVNICTHIIYNTIYVHVHVILPLTKHDLELHVYTK